jgi:hypothetical protein
VNVSGRGVPCVNVPAISVLAAFSVPVNDPPTALSDTCTVSPLNVTESIGIVEP